MSLVFLKVGYVQCQSLGFCYSYGEYLPEVSTVGEPYRSVSIGETFAFNCVMHSYLVKPDQLESEIGPRLLDMVKTLRVV